MTEAQILAGAVVLLLLAAVALRAVRARRAALPATPRSYAPPAAPPLNPLLHDATVVAPAEGQPAGEGDSGITRAIRVITGAPATTYYLSAGRPLVIGRHPEHGIALQSERVSRDHARLVLSPDGTVTITDLGSTNGTFVGQRRRRLRPHTPETVTPGDPLWIGPQAQLVIERAPK